MKWISSNMVGDDGRIERALSKWFSAAILLCSIGGVGFVAILVFCHFFMGVDLPYLSIKNPNSAQYWGQIGDFVGGILNPILSFVALMAVILNLSMQRKELALARKDAEENQLIQSNQSQIFERQNFESVFFKLLEIHSRLSASTRLTSNYKEYQGVDAFKLIEKYYFDINAYGDVLQSEYADHIKSSAERMMADNVEEVGHYFRNIYQILKYVDSLGQDALLATQPSFNKKARAAVKNYAQQRDYANMLRAQLSSSEVSALFLNCLTADGYGLKYYVEKFSMLKTFRHELVGSDTGVRDLYSEIAYADSENISLKTIASISKKHYMFKKTMR